MQHAFFFKFLISLSFSRFLQTQEPQILLLGLIIGYCIPSRCNEMFFKTLISAVFKKNISNFFTFFDLFF